VKNNLILSMKGINKIFPGVQALCNVDFFVNKGEVHALMGENGAGKSTLIKVLTGVYPFESGAIIFDGKEISPKSTLEAQKTGISTIYQELNLVLQQMVYENIFLGRELTHKSGKLNRKEMIAQSEKILTDMGINVDVTHRLADCSTAIQQMVAIARAISINAKLVIMDEPTSSLDSGEVDVLFGVIRKLKKGGVSVIFISHRLDEIFEIADKITILKDGLLVGEYDTKDLDKLKLVSLMIGNEKSAALSTVNNKSICQNDELISVAKVTRGTVLAGIDLTIKKGEIVGLAGLLGSGRTELAKTIFGADLPDEGVMFFNGNKAHFVPPRLAIKKGMGFCTEDRKVEGIIPHMSVAENMTIAYLPHLSTMNVINKKKQMEIVKEFIKTLNIKTPSENQIIRNLSGGNQQKVLLARWLCMNPKMIILDEPTRGIDVGAKAEIEKLIQLLSEKGISVLMISSEIDELVRNCNRVAVLRDGRKMGELEAGQITCENIMDLMARDHVFEA